MEAAIVGKILVRSKQLGLILFWAFFALPCGNLAQQRVTDSTWADQALVTGLDPLLVSNDGNAVFQANINGSGCPMGALRLVFPKATVSGRDVVIPGELGSPCQTVVFRAATSSDFQGIQPGLYKVRLQLGSMQRPVAFVSNQSSNSTTDGSSFQRTNTTLITVVRAPIAGFLGQSSAASRTRAAVTVSVGLDGPAKLPASVVLRVWDSTAVDVEPAVLTWGPGESDTREFTLRLTRAAPTQEASAWAELVRAGNVGLNASLPSRLELDTPRPAFYVVSNQAIYRGARDDRAAGGNGSSSGSSVSGSLSGGGGGGVALSTLGGGSAGRVGSVAVEVRRAGPSPFGSTLLYRAVVLQATGCKRLGCAAVVSGSGLLRVPPDADRAFANVLVNWTALPAETALGVGLQLTPIDNADLAAVPDNATSLYVYGNPYGTCPAGTMGPWQELTMPAAPAPGASAGGAQTSPQGPGASTPPPGTGTSSVSSPALGSLASSLLDSSVSVPRASLKVACDDSALLGALVDYSLSAEMLPVLSVCTGGDVVLVPPNPKPGSASLSGVPPPASAVDAPAALKLPAGPPGRGGGDDVKVGLEVPFGWDSASVLIPLASADGTVVLLGNTCSPDLRLIQAADTAAGAMTGAAAWAALPLPLLSRPCYVRLQVYGNVWAGLGQQQSQGSGNATAFGNVTAQSPANAGGKASSGAAQPSSSRPSPSRVGSSSSSPTGRRRSVHEASPAASAGPLNSDSTSDAGSMRILSSLPLLTFNITLRPLSDPDIFSAGALSLYLLHRPSGLCLPLCGLPQPMLQAAATAVFGDGFNPDSPGSQAQLDVATALTQAIHGGLDAAEQLQAAPGTNSSSGGGSRRLMHVGESLRRWLAAWLPDGWAEAVVGADPVSVAAGRLPAAWRAAKARSNARGPSRGARRAGGSPHRRRALQGGSGSSAQTSTPPPAASQAAELSPPPIAGQSAALSGPQPVVPALPSPAPAPGGPGPSYPGPVAVRPPDGFQLAGALDGGAAPTRVLFNPQFVQWCHSWEPQVVDLALLSSAPHDMAFVANSQGWPLQMVSSGVGREGADGSDGGTAVEVKDPDVLLGPSTRVELLQLLGQGGSGGDFAAQAAAAETGDDADCVTQRVGARPPADKRVAVKLVAPDGVGSAAVALDVYLNFSAATAMAAAAATLKCQNSSRDVEGANNSIATGIAAGTNLTGSLAQAAASALSPPPVIAASPGSAKTGGSAGEPVILSLPPPASLWSACRPCGPGSFSDSANSTSCQLCAPGSASNGTYNKECVACAPGTFTTVAGSAACRPCYAGSYTPRPGSTACTVCPGGTTSLTDGAAECVVPPEPARGDALVVSFQVLLNMSAAGNESVALAASASGLAVPADSIFRMLIAADTAAALRIPPTRVRVTLVEVSPSTFLVNVSATMPLGAGSTSAGSTSAGSSSPGSSSASGPGSSSVAPSPEVDADTLISRLVDNPDGSFPRTREATGGSLQVQLVQRQVVGLDDQEGGVNAHAVVWPTLAGTALLAVALGLVCSRYCRRRRAARGGGMSLPPISNAFDGLCVWKYPTSPPATAFFAYGRFTSLELQEQTIPAAVSATARQRGGRSGGKVSPPVLGMAMAADSATDILVATNTASADLDAMAMRYTLDAMASPRI